MSDRIAIYIDGGYLDKILQLEFNKARINYEALSQWIAGDIDILRTYYYNCLPYQDNPPTPDQSRQFANAQSFHARLNRFNRYEVREGKLEYRGFDNNSGKPIYQQKRIDIMLGVDMVMAASKRRITHAAILTGDSDFLPAIEAAKSEGVIVKLYHSTYFNQLKNVNLKPHKDLWEKADDRVAIDQSVINSILR